MSTTYFPSHTVDGIMFKMHPTVPEYNNPKWHLCNRSGKWTNGIMLFVREDMSNAEVYAEVKRALQHRIDPK